MTRKFYVYLWTNKLNGKQYVGKGHGDRARSHWWEKEKRKSLLSVAMIKYGLEAFELRFIATELTEREALQAEMHAIYALESKAPFGYNRTDGGEGSSGYIHPPEVLAKIAAKNTGRTMSESNRRKLSAANKGRPLAEHVKKALLKANKGRPLSDSHKAKLAAANTGRKMAPEAVAKVVARHLGSKRSQETCRKISERAKGRIIHPDVAKRRVASLVGRPQSPEHIAKRVAAIAKTKAAKRLLTSVVEMPQATEQEK